MSGNTKLEFDRIAEELGTFGRYQVRSLAMACFCVFVSGAMLYVNIFASLTERHRCFVPECDAKYSKYKEKHLWFSTPKDSKEGREWSECEIHPPLLTPTKPLCRPRYFNRIIRANNCTKWIFEKKYFKSTTVSEFGLTCKKGSWKALEGLLYMAGMLIGSLLMGILSDRHGRKLTILISAICCFSGSMGSVLTKNYGRFLASRMCTGAGAAGLFTVTYVAAIEQVSSKWKTACTIIVTLPFVFGELFLLLLAFFIDHWRHLHAAVGSLSLIIILLARWIPESLRWIISQGRIVEAAQMIDNIALINGVKSPSYRIKDLKHRDKEKSSKRTSFFDLLKSKVIRRWCFILMWIWYVCGVSYIGVISNISNLSGNVYTNFLILVAIEAPSKIAALYTMDKIGRKGSISAGTSLAATTFIASALLDSERGNLLIFLSMMGRFGTGLTITCICLYSGEILPTDYRSAGLGIFDVFMRLGGMIAPIIPAMCQQYDYRPLSFIIFGLLNILATLLATFLPETLGYELPQTIFDSEQLRRKFYEYNLIHPLVGIKSVKKKGAKHGNVKIIFEEQKIDIKLHKY